MKHVLELLSSKLIGNGHERIPLMWSDAHKEKVSRVALGVDSGRSTVDGTLADSLLSFARGDFENAELAIVSVLRQNIANCAHDNEMFISILSALFHVQRLDLVSAMLRDKYGFSGELKMSLEDGGIGCGCVRWDTSADRQHNFVFDADSVRRDGAWIEILAFCWAFPLLANYSSQSEIETGSVYLSRTDIGQRPGLAYCDNRPDYFLVPDCIFIPSRGYEYARKVLRDRAIPWEDRANVAFWRGGTTGVPVSPRDWRSLERIQLCKLATSSQENGMFDVGISTIVQAPDEVVEDEIRQSGLLRGPVPWEDWGRYRYLIDIDGNSSPWSNLVQRLLTGSAVLKVQSKRGLQQWFYDDLVPWHNYVPIAPDMSDLLEKVAWLRRNDSCAKLIGANGLKLVETMTYEREMARSVDTISAAFRYFRGDFTVQRPHGWLIKAK